MCQFSLIFMLFGRRVFRRSCSRLINCWACNDVVAILWLASDGGASLSGLLSLVELIVLHSVIGVHISYFAFGNTIFSCLKFGYQLDIWVVLLLSRIFLLRKLLLLLNLLLGGLGGGRCLLALLDVHGRFGGRLRHRSILELRLLACRGCLRHLSVLTHWLFNHLSLPIRSYNLPIHYWIRLTRRLRPLLVSHRSRFVRHGGTLLLLSHLLAILSS